MQYRYQARDAAGNKLSGVLEAPDAGTATKQIEESGLQVLSVEEKGAAGGFTFSLAALGWKRIGIKDILAFTEQLDTLLDAGLPLDRALHVTLGAIENDNLREVIQGIFIEVEKGHTLGDAFARYPDVFPRLYVNMIRAGEEGGILPVVLKRLIEFYTSSVEFRSFLVTSSVYPVLLFVFGISAVLVLTIVVIPKFGEIFADMNQALPTAAAFLIGSGAFLRQYGLYILAGMGAAGVAFKMWIDQPAGREIWQRFLFRLPILGNLILKTLLSRVCRTLGTLLSSGVPILTSMRIVQGLSDNVLMHAAIERLQRAIKEGKGVSRPMLADPFFPRLLGQLAAIGEESGALDRMLLKIADQYETDIKKATKTLIALFEPAMIIGMGGLIGLIVVSMLTAIFSINDMPL